MSDINLGLVECLWLGCTLISLFGCAYALYACSLAARFARQNCAQVSDLEPVSLIKPLYGAEPELVENLASFSRQVYNAPLQIVCGVQSSTDSAVEIVNQVKTEHPDVDLTLVSNAARHGENPKISNIINIMPFVRNGIIILSDSDIRVDAHYVGRVVAALQQPGVGLVTCLYRGRAVSGAWSRLAAAAVDLHFLPGVLVGTALGLAKPCFGSTIALRAETLQRIGGFDAFADTLADDYTMGEAVRGLGLEVAIAPFVVGHTFAETSFAELFAHELRWVRTIRLVDPWGYAGSIVTHPLPFALAALVLSGFSITAGIFVVMTLACRTLLSIQVAGIPGGSGSSIALVPVRDLLSFVVFVVSFVSGKVSWRGRRYEINADGSMKHM